MLLNSSFYQNKTEIIAYSLLGQQLFRETEEGLVSGIIVETEAYLSIDDPACHASRGKTGRNAPMFGPPGHAYVYFIYGCYHCLNVVTGAVGFGEAVLIRAVQPLDGIDLMYQRRGASAKRITDLTSGPGKLCQAFAIEKDFNGHDLREKPLYIKKRKINNNLQTAVTTRIGVSSGKDKKLRFIISGSKYLSRREPFGRCYHGTGN